MTATATAMVKAIWQSYFTVTAAAEDAGQAATAGAAETAKEVEEVRLAGPRAESAGNLR